MVNKTIKYNIKYLQNCNYEASEINEECKIPQQYVDININVENISARNRVGYNNVTQIDYQNNNKIYYNDVLKVTVSVNIVNLPLSIVNIGSLSINYLNEDMESESLFGTDVPLSETGQVIFTFKPHYNGYIQIIYNDSSNFFITKEQKSSLINIDKIPINTYTTVNPIFLNYEEPTEITCNVIDVYGKKINYGHVVFLGYHDIPRDSENPLAGQEVVLGNPAPVINGEAKLQYSPEQDIDIEYIVGHYNYYNERYGSNFKYYEAHGSHTSISIKNKRINFATGVLKNDSIIDTTIFDGFIHAEQGETLRANVSLLDKNNDEINIPNNARLILYIKGTKHIINKSYANAKAKNVETWMKDNVIFEEYEDIIELDNKIKDINNIPPGYYNIYVTFKNEDTTEEYTSNIAYIAINQPNIVLNPILSYINPVDNKDNTYKAQVNDDLSTNLKATCENAPINMKGEFIINDIHYSATYKDNAFISDKSIRINKIGDYYIHFSTNPAYYNNQGYYPSQIATPIILQMRDILEPIIEIPEGYIDNQYPGQIKYILSVKNWYDETGVNITVNIRNINTDEIIQTYIEDYKGSAIHKEINDLTPGTYRIEATIGNKTSYSSNHTINKANLKGEINELSGSKIISGMLHNIQYDIEAEKPILTSYIINNAKIYAKQGNNIIPFNITSENIILNPNKKILSIYYPILLYLDGNWDIKFVQSPNPSFDSETFIPNNNNLNGFITQAKTFNIKRIQANIGINKDNDNIQINITNNASNNNQILLIKLKISYGDLKDIEIPILTNKDNSINIPLADIHEDFESIVIRQQIYNIKVTVDPYNDELLNNIKDLSTNEAKAVILEEYDSLYNTELLNDFVNQIKEQMLYTALFATYDKTIKSENYGN